MISLDAIRARLTGGEFFLEYMPIVSLADGRYVGAEALARWRRGSGVVQPDEFIKIIEGTHLSGTLTYWVIETMAKELGDWLRAHKEAFLSVNVPRKSSGVATLEAASQAGIRIVLDDVTLSGTNLAVLSRLQALRRAGIPMAQGYYFSPPIPAEKLKAYYARAANLGVN